MLATLTATKGRLCSRIFTTRSVSPRALGPGLTAHIARKDVRVLPIFDRIAAAGGIPERDMFNTFNMGVGMVAVVAPEDAGQALKVLREAGEDAYVLGAVREGAEGVGLA